MNIEFSTTNISNAQRFLSHSSFKYLNEDQKSLILNNLGSFRVLDPEFHPDGVISCENEHLSVTLIQLGEVEEESFMFKYSCLYLNLALVKWGIEEKRFKPYKHSLDKIIRNERRDFIDYYLERNIITPEELADGANWSNCSFDFYLDLYENVIKKKIKYTGNIATLYSAKELLILAQKKLLSVNSLKYSNRDKYNEIIRLKKLNKR